MAAKIKFKTMVSAVRGERWCRLLTLLMRLVVGGVFVFSGFVKAVDPWGTCYKITDYMMALGLERWAAVALFAAVALAAFEFLLGISMVMGAYRRGAPWLALLLLLVMTPLTLWLAVTGAVSDCGCFGDALHLSNWATFAKNVFLLLGVVWLLLFNTSLRGVYGPAVQWVLLALSLALVLAVAACGYFVQPLIDFRPYPTGTQLVAATGDASAAEQGEEGDGDDDFIFIYSKNGEEHEFRLDSLPDEDDGWQYVTRYHARRPRGKVIVQTGGSGNAIAIMDSEGNDVTADVMDGRRQLLLLFPDLPQVSLAHAFALNRLTRLAQLDAADVVGLTSATEAQVGQWQDVALADYPIYTMDDSEIKMLARGNPAVVYVDEGKVVWKRTFTSLDVPDETSGITLRELDGDRNDDRTTTALMLAYLAGLVLLLMFNRTHLLLRKLGKRATSHANGTQEP